MVLLIPLHNIVMEAQDHQNGKGPYSPEEPVSDIVWPVALFSGIPQTAGTGERQIAQQRRFA